MRKQYNWWTSPATGGRDGHQHAQNGRGTSDKQIMSGYSETKVIGLSVNATSENDKAMKRADAVLVMTKEAAVEQLYAAIQKVLVNIEGHGRKMGNEPA